MYFIQLTSVPSPPCTNYIILTYTECDFGLSSLPACAVYRTLTVSVTLFYPVSCLPVQSIEH